MELEYLEDMNLYMGTTWDQVLDIINNPEYSKIFRDELRDFLNCPKDTAFAFVGDIKTADPTSQGVLMIKANEGLDEGDDDPIVYFESIAHVSDIYHKIKRKEKKLGDFFKPYMTFIKTNFT